MAADVIPALEDVLKNKPLEEPPCCISTKARRLVAGS